MQRQRDTLYENMSWQSTGFLLLPNLLYVLVDIRISTALRLKNNTRVWMHMAEATASP